MLVVFPMAPQHHNVVQTAVHKVYAFRLELLYQDPRYDIRHAIPLALPITLQPVPMTLLTAIERQHGQLVRQITLTSDEASARARMSIADLFYPAGAPEPADPHVAGLASLTGALQDISLGGTCLTLDAGVAQTAQRYRLVRLTIPLLSLGQSLPSWTEVSLTLRLLAVVCCLRQVSSTPTLHLRFLNRLFPELDALFWHLEGRGPQTP
jgi:hypothetical protein